MNEYKKALKRLTLGYILAIFIACAAFTLPVLILARHHIGDSVAFFNHNVDLLGQAGVPADLRARVTERATEGQRHLLTTTIAVDTILLGLGSIASYFFARKTLQPLEAAHKAQRRFTADASHELRTPLAVMQTNFEVALKAKKSRTELEHTMQEAIDEIRGLSTLTEKLLQLSRADSSKIHNRRVNLSVITEDAIRQFERAYDTPVVRHIDASLHIAADATLLYQLLHVILDNARKYTSTTPADIQVRLVRNGDQGLLEVADKGIGIAKEDLPHVFDRLYRGTNTARFDGHGLGLALAKSIADLHGWKLSIVSELGRATTVQLWVHNLATE